MAETRYYIEYGSTEMLKQLAAEATARGIDVDEDDDWYDPLDLEVYADGTEDLGETREIARKIAATSIANEARILERRRIFIEGIPDWESDYVEYVYPIQPIVLVGCSAQKGKTRCRADELYTSALFRKSLAYARTLTSEDRIFILSAKHTAIRPRTMLSPYDLALADLSPSDRSIVCAAMAGELMEQEQKRREVDRIWKEEPLSIICLAGSAYGDDLRRSLESGWKHLVSVTPSWHEPLRGMQIGERLHWLGQQLQEHATREVAISEVAVTP